MNLKVLFAHPNSHFLDFITQFLTRFNYEVIPVKDNDQIINRILSKKPQLIIINGHFGDKHIRVTLEKKNSLASIKDIPLYIMGNLDSKQIIYYKRNNVSEFINQPVNPYVILDKVNKRFNRKNNLAERRTPMLADTQVQGKIFTIQIEGNFETDKLDILNFKIRSYCKKNKIEDPRFLFIFPSVYPESINEENILALFHFINYEELKIKKYQIKILTRINEIKEVIGQIEFLNEFEFVPDLLTGIQKLRIDFDQSSLIPVSFLKPGSTYILDLFDQDQNLQIPALTKITEQKIDRLNALGITQLVYFSEKNISEIMSARESKEKLTFETEEEEQLYNINEIMSQYHSVDNEHLTDDSTEKMTLFFNKIKGDSALIVSNRDEDIQLIKEALEKYLEISFQFTGNGVLDSLSKKNYIMTFIDIEVNDPNSIQLLQSIRSQYTRNQMTVVINARKIDIKTLSLFKKYGTDYILIPPYSKDKILKKVYQFITTDRTS